MSDTLKIHGIVRASLIPQEWGIEDILYYWTDQHDAEGYLIHRAAMRERERLKYAVYEAENLVTTAGLSTILTALSLSPTSAQWFSHIFAAGSGAVSGVSRADTVVAGEGGLANNRQNAVGYSITGSQTDITYVYNGTDGQGDWTNIGLFVGGSATINTGTLMTHALYSYTKPNANISLDYIITVSN